MDDQFDKTRYEIRQKLAEVVRNHISWQIACITIVLLWLGYLLDRTFEPSSEVRQYALLILAASLSGWFLFRVLPTLWYQPSDQQIVGLMARAKPESADLIFSADQPRVSSSQNASKSEDDTQAELMRSITRQQANHELMSIDCSRLFHGSIRTRWARLAIVAGMAAIIAGLSFPSEASFYFKRLALSNESWPRLVRLVPEGFKFDSSEGIWIRHFARHSAVDLRLTAKLSGNTEAPSSILVKSSKLFGRKYPDSMLRIGEVIEEGSGEANYKRSQQYLLRLDDLSSSTDLKLRGGDDHIRVRLIATDQPAITSSSIKVTPPAYLNRSEAEFNPSMLGELPEGSSCLITLQPSKSLSEVNATWLSDEEQRSERLEAIYQSGRIEIKIPPLMQSGIFSVMFADQYGIESSHPFEIPIEIQADAPPVVSAKMITYGKLITRQARLPIAVRIDDDYSIKRSYLELNLDSDLIDAEGSGEMDSRTVELAAINMLPQEINKDVELSSLFKEEAALKEGDRIRVRVAAQDFYDLKPRSDSLSEALILQVVSSEELIATLADRERELRKRLEATLSDARRLAYSIRRTSESIDISSKPSEWLVETEKISRDLSGMVAQIQSIHDEVINNRLDRSSLTDRLKSAVLDPLKSLISNDLGIMLAQLKSELQANPLDNATRQVKSRDTEIALFVDSTDNVVRVLTLVIEAMQTNESYNEIVAALRTILRDQKKLNQLTERERREQAKRILLEGGFDDF